MGKIIATYHKDCVDGTTAAAVVLRKFPQVLLFPLSHSYTEKDITPIIDLLDSRTECYTVDSALGVKEFLNAGCMVTTIDHHIGVKEDLEQIAKENKNYTYVFDNEKSGASLAWSYFFPDESLPELIKYVEDSDLWKQRFGNDTKYVNHYLSMFWNNPAAMLGFMESDLLEVKEKGKVITMYVDREVTDQITYPPINLKIGEWVVPAYNITVHVSASGNTISKGLNKAVSMFTILGGNVRFNFRSLDNQEPSALKLAQTIGGNGHKNVAGASISLDQFLNMIVR